MVGGGGNGKMRGKGMSAARQISRRFGRTTGTRARSAEKYCNMSLAAGVVSDG